MVDSSWVADALTRCVGDPTAFATQFWGQRPMHRPAADDDFSDLLSIDAVDRMAATSTRRPAIRVVRNGKNLPPATYCRAIRLGGQHLSDVADAWRLGDELAGGSTIVLQSLHRTWMPIQDFATELEDLVSHPVQVNAYLTPPQSAGLRPHDDGHDVIAIQLSGSKCWNVDGLGDLVLKPGAVLYIPAGVRHQACTSSDHSLHLTVGLMPITYRALVRRILDATETDLDLPLPLGYARGSAEDFASVVKAALGAAVDHLSSVDPSECARTELERRRPRRNQSGHIRSVLDAAGSGLETEVVLRPAVKIERDQDANRVQLKLDGRTLSLPSSTRQSLLQLGQVGGVRVSELVGLDDDSKLVLVRRLLQEGFAVRNDAARSTIVESGPDSRREADVSEQ